MSSLTLLYQVSEIVYFAFLLTILYCFNYVLYDFILFQFYTEFERLSTSGSAPVGTRAAIVPGEASSSQSQPMSCD
jgi:hypothetical protein